MSKTPLENFAPSAPEAAGSKALSAHVYNDLMPQTFSRPTRGDVPRSLNFAPDIYHRAAADSPPLKAEQIRPILDKASGITITSPEQNQKSGQQPDFILGTDGRLRANPEKTTPNKDGSVNIEVQSKNKSEIDAKKLANQLQKAAVKDLIAYFKKDNPTGKVPQDWLDQLNQEPDLPPPVVPLDPAPQPVDLPSPPPPQDLPQAPAPQPTYDGGGGSSGGGSSGGGSGGDGGGYSGGGSSGGGDGGGYSGGGSDSTVPHSDAPAEAFTGPVPEGDLAIAGPPTITPQKIDEVLAQYHSPAAGLGQYVYDQGIKNGINPAVALAFFVQESSCGTAGVAVQNNSWGNIRGDGVGGFKHYDNFKEGVDDWYRLIKDQYLAPKEQGGFGCKTLSEVISHYAPSADNNNETAYVNNVKGMVDKWAHA